MKPGAIVLILAALLTTGWRDARIELKVTTKDYREILKMLRGIEDTLDDLDDAVSKDGPDDCRGLSPEKTVRCAAHEFGTSEEQAVSVWECESNFGTEGTDNPGHVYHGAMQYLYSTYESQQEAMPDVVEWYELSPAVHDMRSNILTAVAWASRHGWSAWSCA